jgi:hypothetical protein
VWFAVNKSLTYLWQTAYKIMYVRCFCRRHNFVMLNSIRKTVGIRAIAKYLPGANTSDWIPILAPSLLPSYIKRITVGDVLLNRTIEQHRLLWHDRHGTASVLHIYIGQFVRIKLLQRLVRKPYSSTGIECLKSRVKALRMLSSSTSFVPRSCFPHNYLLRKRDGFWISVFMCSVHSPLLHLTDHRNVTTATQ